MVAVADAAVLALPISVLGQALAAVKTAFFAAHRCCADALTPVRRRSTAPEKSTRRRSARPKPKITDNIAATNPTIPMTTQISAMTQACALPGRNMETLRGSTVKNR